MVEVLSEARWRALEQAHHDRAQELTAGHRARRAAGRRHPVEDFLFTYYSVSPGRLARWHPGPGVALARAAGTPRAAWRFYATGPDGTVGLDLDAYRQARGDSAEFIRRLLAATAARPGRFTCFGLHEWAMVYGIPASDVRHAGWPLRLGSAGTDQVVASSQIACSHFDAYRFFTDAARPLNTLGPTRDRQVEMEQPGCLHAGMDLYNWAAKLGPLVPGDLLLDCFEFARDARELDMRASPYDLAALGYPPIAIETPQGRTEYASAQRALSERAQALRHRLLTGVAALPGGVT